jgi:hypothetical protein
MLEAQIRKRELSNGGLFSRIGAETLSLEGRRAENLLLADAKYNSPACASDCPVAARAVWLKMETQL